MIDSFTLNSRHFVIQTGLAACDPERKFRLLKLLWKGGRIGDGFASRFVIVLQLRTILFMGSEPVIRIPPLYI